MRPVFFDKRDKEKRVAFKTTLKRIYFLFNNSLACADFGVGAISKSQHLNSLSYDNCIIS